MTIFKRNELTWYPMPERIRRERADLERLQDALYKNERPHFKGGKSDDTDEGTDHTKSTD